MLEVWPSSYSVLGIGHPSLDGETNSVAFSHLTRVEAVAVVK